MRLAVAAAVIFSLAALAGTIKLPPASSGEINGKTALLMWPASLNGELLDPSNCQVLLSPYTDLDKELSFPCGEWFQPPPGKYLHWLEKDESWITPSPKIVIYVGTKFEGSSLRSVLPLVPAGKVTLRSPFPATQSFRLLHIPEGAGRGFHRSMDRRARGDSMTPLLMPEGDVIAAVFDVKTSDALALTRPVRVQQSRVTYVHPQPPKDSSDVLAVYDRPGIRPRTQTEDAVMVLRTPDGDRPPDILSDTANRVIAVWYGVSARSADLVFKSAAEHVATETLRLVPGRVATVRRTISKLPKAEIDIHAPEDIGSFKLAVETTTGTAIRTINVAPGITHIDDLPADELTFTLSAGEWQFTKNIDLRSGADGRVDFEVEPLIIEGNVFHGGDGAAAEVSFSTGKRELAKTKTDTEGRYRVMLLRPGTYVARIAVPDVEPYQQGFVAIDESRDDLDFHVPRNQFRVRVTDATTGKPIANARVGVTNNWDGYRQMESRRTSDDGIARLPPLRAGNADVRADADGYRQSQPIPFTVENESRERQLEVTLQPFGDDVRIQILGANGAPAIGADLRLIASTSDDRPLWEAKYNAAEGVGVPIIRENALLLLRHQGSASRVVALSRNLEPLIRLSPEAPPLVVKTQTETGEPAAFAKSGLWFGPYRMTTMSLGFLTWSPSAIASRDGVWIARGLPQSGTRVFAWRKNTATAIAGGFDALAMTISHPWAEVVMLRTVD